MVCKDKGYVKGKFILYNVKVALRKGYGLVKTVLVRVGVRCVVLLVWLDARAHGISLPWSWELELRKLELEQTLNKELT